MIDSQGAGQVAVGGRAAARERSVPGAPGVFQEARDTPGQLWVGLETAHASLASEKGEGSPDRGRKPVFSGLARQILPSMRLGAFTKGSPVTADQRILSLQLLPCGPQALTQAGARAWLSLRTQGCCYVVDFISNFRQQGPQWENQESKHFIKFFFKDLGSPVIWK